MMIKAILGMYNMIMILVLSALYKMELKAQHLNDDENHVWHMNMVTIIVLSVGYKLEI